MSIRSAAYNEEISLLESGLRQLLNSKNKAKTHYKLMEINNEIKIQHARIKFFKVGYDLAKMEMREQRKLCQESLQK